MLLAWRTHYKKHKALARPSAEQIYYTLLQQLVDPTRKTKLTFSLPLSRRKNAERMVTNGDLRNNAFAPSLPRTAPIGFLEEPLPGGILLEDGDIFSLEKHYRDKRGTEEENDVCVLTDS
ncbi:unnamed protein product [Calypogeia fissa]